VLKISAPANPSSLDPAKGVSGTDHVQLYTMYDTLVEWDFQTLEARPGLAEAWEFADPKTLMLKLREGVTFHDGTPFNADAVKFNIDRDLTNKNSRRTSELSSIKEVQVVDPSTVKFILKAPFAPLLANLVDRAGMMVSPTAAQNAGDDFTRMPMGGGTGPFKFVEWKKDDHVTLEANKDY